MSLSLLCSTDTEMHVSEQSKHGCTNEGDLLGIEVIQGYLTCRGAVTLDLAGAEEAGFLVIVQCHAQISLFLPAMGG